MGGEISNDAVRTSLKVHSVAEEAMKSRLRWWGHVQRMETGSIPKGLDGVDFP